MTVFYNKKTLKLEKILRPNEQKSSFLQLIKYSLF